MANDRKLSASIRQAREYPLVRSGHPDATPMHVNTVLGLPLREIAKEIDHCSPALQALLRIALTDSLRQDPRFASAVPAPVFSDREIQIARARVVEALDAWTVTAKERRDLIKQALDQEQDAPAPAA